MRLVYKGLRTKLNINNKNPRTKIPLPNSAPSSPSMQRRPLRVNTSGFPTASASYRKETLNGIQRLNTTQRQVHFFIIFDKVVLILLDILKICF